MAWGCCTAFAFLLAMGNSLSAIALIFRGVILACSLIRSVSKPKKDIFDRMESMIRGNGSAAFICGIDGAVMEIGRPAVSRSCCSVPIRLFWKNTKERR